MNESSVFGAVLGSGVRTDVLASVAETPRTTAALKDCVDASESAVYDAVGDLEEQGLLRTVGDEWTTTGSGRLVADTLARQENLDRLLEMDYWRRHDVGAIPQRYRRRLTALADAEVVRAPDSDPHAVVRKVCDRIENGGRSVDIVSPIYQSEYAAAMPDADDARLLLDETVVEDAIERLDDPRENRQLDHTSVRVLDVDVGLGVTDSVLMLSLPTLNGQYDSRTEVFATGERALAWGRDLYEYYWQRATPAEAFLDERLR